MTALAWLLRVLLRAQLDRDSIRNDSIQFVYLGIRHGDASHRPVSKEVGATEPT